jgi:hypothetical protein
MSRFPAVVALLAVFAVPSPALAQAPVSDSVEFARWRQVNVEDLNGLHEKFVSLARAMPPAKLGWRPMDGVRSFHDVLAHIAAEGFIEGVSLGRPLPAGSLADFDAEESRLRALPDDQLITAMDQALTSLAAGFTSLSLGKMNTPVTYFGRPTLPRIIALYTLADLHEHLGQLVSYARMNQVVPPWSRGH